MSTRLRKDDAQAENMATMQLLKIYVINLDGSTERLNDIQGVLSGYGIAFERVPAFDGRDVDLESVVDYDMAHAERYMGRRLVGGEIGCYRSHLDVAKRFLETNASYALVLEDDALPLCDLSELLASVLPQLDIADRDWLLINIGNNKLKITTPLGNHSVGAQSYELLAAHYFPMTTSAIVWSRKGADRFVSEHRTIFAPVDNYFRHWLTRVGHGYSLWPAPVTTTDASSLIVSAVGSHRKRNGRKWYYSLAKQKRLLIDKVIAAVKRRNFRPLKSQR